MSGTSIFDPVLCELVYRWFCPKGGAVLDPFAGGSKVRFLPYLIGDAKELVFGAPFCGGAPVALSEIGKRTGIKITIFYAKRINWHARQRLVMANGATVVPVPMGFMTNVQAKARAYAQSVGAKFFPLGFDVPEAQAPFIDAISRVRARVGDPSQVWCATGSGMLARCIGLAFPNSEVWGVAVGLRSRWQKQVFPPNVRIIESGVPFERECKEPVPFNSCPNYDRKAWIRCLHEGQGTRLFWNVL